MPDTTIRIRSCLKAFPQCSLYFTTDGSLPNPLRRCVSDRDLSGLFLYREPFKLSPGRRSVMCVAIARYLKC